MSYKFIAIITFAVIFVVACTKELDISDSVLLLEESDNQTTRIFSVHPDGSNLSSVIEFDRAYLYWFSPNGKYVILINRSRIDDSDLPPGTLQVVDVDSGKVLRRIDDVNHFALEMFDSTENVTWSHQEDKFLFLRESKGGNGINLWVYDLDTDSLNQLTYGEAIDRSPAWSLDDEKIAFVTLEACDGSPWNCAPTPERFGELYWKIATIKVTGTDNHVIADFEKSGLLRPAMDLTMFCNLVWSPNGEYIAFENLCDLGRPFPTEKEVFVTSADGANVWQITNDTEDGTTEDDLVTFFSYHWPSDNNLLIGFSAIPQQLYSTKEGDFQGGFLATENSFSNVSTQEILNAETGSGTWSPMGHYVLWFSNQRKNNLWEPQGTSVGEAIDSRISELATSSELPLGTRCSRCIPVWSPDENYVAYVVAEKDGEVNIECVRGIESLCGVAIVSPSQGLITLIESGFGEGYSPIGWIPSNANK